MAELLPVGSIVELSENSNVCYMIIGYYPMYQDQIWEYTAVMYPAGLSGRGILEKFDAEQIHRVVWEGFQDEEAEKLLKRIPEFMNATATLMNECAEIVERVQKEGGEQTDGLEETGEFDIQMD